MLNYMIYEKEFPSVQMKDYAANVITENMLSQFDDKQYSVTLVNLIVDYKWYYPAIEKDGKCVVTRREKVG